MKRSQIIYISILLFLASPLVWSAKQIVNGGPNDYYDPDSWIQNYVNLVEKHHLEPAKEQISKGYTTSTTGQRVRNIWEELDFTLRWFPNHPEGLRVMAQWLPKYPHPPGKTVEYYFEKAISYQPTPTLRPVDANVRVLYGIYLHKSGKLERALEQYKLALQINPRNPEIHYNLGLLYVAQTKYTNALEHAKKAYSAGYPLPGLRNKLITAGVWNKEDKQ